MIIIMLSIIHTSYVVVHITNTEPAGYIILGGEAG